MSANSYRRCPARTAVSRCDAMALSCGQSAVEFALVLIVAMIVLFVGIQMAVIGQAALALGQMNYQGARYAAINKAAACTDVASYMESVGSPTVTKDGVSCGAGTGGGCTGATGVQVTMTCPGAASCTGRAFGAPVQVSLCFNAASLLFLSPDFFGIGFPTTLTSTQTAMSE